MNSTSITSRRWGGPESGSVGRGAVVPDLSAMIDQFDRNLDFRSTQFSALESVLLGRQLSQEVRPSGRPVVAGYISSYFGERMDPFNGEEAFHKGLDFASDSGADVLAVAQGSSPGRGSAKATACWWK